MYTVHCTRTNSCHQLGAEHVLSAHHTGGGVVTYLRCPCGDVAVQQRPPAGRVPSTAAQTVQHQLGRLWMLAEHFDLPAAAVDLVHEILVTLTDAAERGLEEFTFARPEPTDPPVTMLRALGRLAQRINGHPVSVSGETATHLDRLIDQLALALADEPATAPCARRSGTIRARRGGARSGQSVRSPATGADLRRRDRAG